MYWIYNLFLVFLITVIILAAIGRSIGVRTTYIQLLLWIFNWSKVKIERHHSRTEHYEPEEEEQDNKLYDQGTKGDNVNDGEEGFQMADVTYFTSQGMQAIVDDHVTKSFDAAELPSWNMLTRTNTNFQFISVHLTIIWFLGCIIRYFILFPFRLILTCVAIVVMFSGTLVIGYFPNGRFKKVCHKHLSQTAYRIMSRALSAVVTFHNKENRSQGGGICVANHTTPFDIIILGGDNCYTMVGQMQGGFFGFMQKAFSRAEQHIWFERTESKDRSKVTKRLKEHSTNLNNLPILIFPEGMCINNEHVLQFKKGSFEVGVTIHPIAIKYNPLFADPFWGHSQNMVLQHLALILTSWAIVVDIWYLPPTSIQENETAIEFASRVKSQIAEKAGMADLDWDASLKYQRPKPDMLLKQQQQYTQVKRLLTS